MDWTTNEVEDWVKDGPTWDVRRPDGTPVETLAELAAAVGSSESDAARDVLRLPFGRSAPAYLLAEARAEQQGSTA